MALEITIKGVPEDVYARLSARAAMQEKSLEDFLQEELNRMAQPLVAVEWLNEVRRLNEREPTRVPSEVILKLVGEDRE